MTEKNFSDMRAEHLFEDLRDRVKQYNMLQLPGQPLGMHMGTSYLIGDLWHELYPILSKRAEGKA